MLSNVLDTFHVVYLRSHPKVLLHLGIPHCRHVLHLQFAVDQTALDLVPMKKRKAKERRKAKNPNPLRLPQKEMKNQERAVQWLWTVWPHSGILPNQDDVWI